MSTEQVKEFTEAIEDSKRQLRQTYSERGIKLGKNGKVVDSNYTGRDFRRDAVKDLKN
jgi:hypothetical protein